MMCELCSRRSPYVGLVCNPCRTNLARALWNLIDLYEELPDHVEAKNVPSAIGPVSGTKERKTPLNLDVVALQKDVPEVLRSWVDCWCDELNLQNQSSRLAHTSKLVLWLNTHLNDACDKFGPIAEFANEVHHLKREMRRAMSMVANRVRFEGLCSNCQNTTLILNRDEGTVRCPVCDDEFGLDDESRHIDLGTHARNHTDAIAVKTKSVFTCEPGKPCPDTAELIAVVAASQLLGVSKQRFNNWVNRRKLVPHGMGERGTNLYRTCCVLALARVMNPNAFSSEEELTHA